MTEEEARKIFEETVRPYQEAWQLLDDQRDSLKKQWGQAIVKANKARQEFRKAQKKAKKEYYKNIGDPIGDAI
jgi:TRAP-type C4-dicarboxylate transport system substrate-binding protein